MDNYSSGFIAQISYLEEKMQKFRKIALEGILGEFWGILGEFWGNFGIFWGIFGFWDIFNILYFLFFIN
jgi:hypothetical protein